MNLNLVTKEEFGELNKKIESISEAIQKMSLIWHNRLFSNAELCKFLGISSKTLQSYRDQGVIEFSQIGRKIYYSEAAVNNFLENHKKAAFKIKLNNHE